MRTTVDIQDHLLRQAKMLAAANGCKLADIVNQAMLMMLSRPQPKRKRKVKGFVMKSYGGGGIMPGVDLRDMHGLMDIMDNAIMDKGQ